MDYGNDWKQKWPDILTNEDVEDAEKEASEDSVANQVLKMRNTFYSILFYYLPILGGLKGRRASLASTANEWYPTVPCPIDSSPAHVLYGEQCRGLLKGDDHCRRRGRAMLERNCPQPRAFIRLHVFVPLSPCVADRNRSRQMLEPLGLIVGLI